MANEKKLAVIKIDISRIHGVWMLQPHYYADSTSEAEVWGDAQVYDDEEEAFTSAKALADWIVRSGEAHRAEVYSEVSKYTYEANEVTDQSKPATITLDKDDVESDIAEGVRVSDPETVAKVYELLYGDVLKYVGNGKYTRDVEN